MPNFDAGRYFLTVLAPIRAGSENGLSHRNLLREALSVLPTALQSPATREIGVNSPFSRNCKNHLARFAIIDDLIYNGADPVDPLVGEITKTDPIYARPVDQLSTAYLMFTAEIDAVRAEGQPLPAHLSLADQEAVRDAYATTLWTTMERELRDIFQHCHGFDRVQTASDFAGFLKRAQVETTMPFNDYYTTPVTLPALPLPAILAVIALPFALFVLALVGWLFHMAAVPVLGWGIVLRPLPVLFWSLLATGLALFLVWRVILALGQKPLPPAEDASLPEVLKALYLRTHFTRFAEDQQGADPSALYAAFGDFLERHRPPEPEPTQPPGIIPIPPRTGGDLHGAQA